MPGHWVELIKVNFLEEVHLILTCKGEKGCGPIKKKEEQFPEQGWGEVSGWQIMSTRQIHPGIWGSKLPSPTRCTVF